MVRENTEGFYADRNMASGSGEMLVTPEVAVSLRRITRGCCLRIARAAFELALRRRGRVTAVHKANVLKIGDGMFLDCCREVARDFPGIALEEVLVDAMMAHVVRAPGRFDVVVTTNMFGDILSDLTAELSGSLGLGGSLNAGDAHAMAQAAHGSAPDIAGQDVANPSRSCSRPRCSSGGTGAAAAGSAFSPPGRRSSRRWRTLSRRASDPRPRRPARHARCRSGFGMPKILWRRSDTVCSGRLAPLGQAQGLPDALGSQW